MDILNNAISQGIVPAIVVAIYLIITKIIDNKRDSAQIKLTTELTNSINTIAAFLSDVTENVINKDKEKCKIAIEDSMYSSGMRLINFVSSTTINNHINTNKENILINIHNIINSEYYNIYRTLYLYKINSTKASDFLKKEWFDDIEQDMINTIYNTDLSKEDKILSFSNKLNFKFKSYITYIINNVIK